MENFVEFGEFYVVDAPGVGKAGTAGGAGA